MTNHPSTSEGISQCDLIMLGLTARIGQWVPMPRLAMLCGGYAVHSRISDLRQRGHRIDQRNRRLGRKVLSEYRLAETADNGANTNTEIIDV